MNHDASEGLAQALFEESGDALFLFDPETDELLDANAKTQRLTGFSLRELLRLPMDQLFLFGGPGGLQRVRQASMRTGTFHSQEGYYLRTVHPETWIPINLTVSRLHVKPKTLALITARDIREQRQIYNQLKQMEADLRRIIVSISDCIWSGEINNFGRIVVRFISPVVTKIAGRPQEFFLEGTNRWWGIVHAEDQPRWEETIVRLRSTDSTQEEYRVVWPDGSVRWVREQIRATPSTDGKPLRLDGVLHDITEQKQAEEKLHRSEERFRAFIDNSPALAFMKDPEGRLIYYNKSFARVFQTTSGSLLGKTVFDRFPAELARTLQHNDDAALASAQTLEVIERVPTPDGVVRAWLVFKFPVDVAEGRGFLGGLAIELKDPSSMQSVLSKESVLFGR
jgi:PAS domain S-box-containing protein